jgi:hypothetical protein
MHILSATILWSGSAAVEIMPEEQADEIPTGEPEELSGSLAGNGDTASSANVLQPVGEQSGSSEPPPLPRTPERVERPRPDAVPKAVIRRLAKSVGISLPRNRYRIFLGKGIIPPVSEVKQFVAPLAEINRVRIRIMEGEEDHLERLEFLGEIGINNIKLREDGKAELEIEFSLSATGILTVRLTDRIGETEGMGRYFLPQFKKEGPGEGDVSTLPVEELSRKIDLLEQQMQLLRGELEVRRERQ